MKIYPYLSLVLFTTLFSPSLFAKNIVVVKSNSRFYADATAKDMILHSPKSKGYLSLEMIKEKSGFILVKVNEQNPGCYKTIPTYGLDLALWVKKKIWFGSPRKKCLGSLRMVQR